jgi:hypothetical protein
MRVLIVFAALWLGLPGASSNAAEASPSASIGDGRTPINLTPSERDYVLAGMREHVGQIQSIVDALAADDRQRAQAAALLAGTRHFLELTDHPPGLAAKWPEAWKLMLRARLQSFDALAQGIHDGESTSRSLERLSNAMQTCTACHAAFRLVSEHE